ncbi:MAG: N-acyl-D-amino-acid deacylase [Gammaproteobacteria bacterium]|jgi:N-acyl-D-aspartate/D-glutamate deacylase|nr:N-acyl-D-amino-acid deacylase [Gammaproteobacteria bacterium]
MIRKSAIHRYWPLLVVGSVLGAPASAQTYDLIIRGGTIYDGNGGTPWVGDVAVEKGKIVAVQPRVAGTATRIVDARGLAVSPGFIDPHTHDIQAIRTVKGSFLDEQDLAQGITTVILGPDGQESPKSLQELISAARRQGTSQNYGCYVGHNGIRAEVIGHAHRAATATEMEQMKAQVRQGMALGCVGLSAGLMYDPGMFSPPEEIVDLAKEVQPFDGIYDSHSRNPVTDFIGSELETAHIGIAAGIPAKLGHIKAVGLTNKGKSTELIAAVNALRSQGHQIVGDVYPYDGAAALDLQDLIIFPSQTDAHGLSNDQKQAKIKAAIADAVARAALKETSEKGLNNGFSWIKVGAYTASRIVVAPGQPQLVGKFISVLAQERGEDPFDILTQILANAKGPIIMVIGTIDEQDMRNFLVQPWDMISRDSSYIGLPIPAHLRSTGAFARVLGRYVRDMKLLSLQEAVRKMTSLPADFLRLYDRGRLAPG